MCTLFKHGQDSEVRLLQCMPATATGKEIIDKIHDMVLNDRQLKVYEISQVMRISIEYLSPSYGGFTVVCIK